MNSTNPNDDEIITEVRAVREQLAARFGYDVKRLYEEAKRLEKDPHVKLAKFAPKPVERQVAERE